MTYPYATQQQGWSSFASELDALALGINPATLLRGQYGGKISEAIDELTVIVGGVERLSDSASELAGVCGVQDSFDRELASCPATKDRVEKAEAEAKQAQVMLRAGQCEPELAELVIARADELAKERQEAIDKHAEQTSTTHFDEPESVGLPDAHYPGGTEGEPGKGEPGKKGGIERKDKRDGGDSADTGEEKTGDNPEPPKSPLEPEKPPPTAPMHPEPGRGKYMTPMPEPVRQLPEIVEPETKLSRGDASLVAPSSTMLGQQTPQATAQQPQFTGVTQPQGRMLGHMNPQNAPNSRKERQEPEGNRPVASDTLAAVAATPVATAPTHATAPSPNVSTPGTHTASASTPASTTPSANTPGGTGPAPVGAAPTIGPGNRTSITGGGMREKPTVPDNLKAVLSEQTVRDLEAALSDKFPDPEPTPPNTDPVPTGALR